MFVGGQYIVGPHAAVLGHDGTASRREHCMALARPREWQGNVLQDPRRLHTLNAQTSKTAHRADPGGTTLPARSLNTAHTSPTMLSPLQRSSGCPDFGVVKQVFQEAHSQGYEVGQDRGIQHSA